MAAAEENSDVSASPLEPTAAGFDGAQHLGRIASMSQGLPPDASVDSLAKRMPFSLSGESNRRLSAHELTALQCTALLRLQAGHRATVGDLARALSIDGSAMTRLLDRLERKNLTVRVRIHADRRVVHVELTDEGRALKFGPARELANDEGCDPGAATVLNRSSP